ncbi:CocE/NonD family hydrolase [Reinekea thalattae]|uniref:CocE/NonD family hydrolase n=1 Tax=Reinekea thalattae TaxID=2593301 RepID=A0A5C8Z8A1_9GAMM|nr:CocE/NonD family hydrolase [Reinekea thalattae]TXR53381.1 CocE/NonD family hydrolase [Reinekea thalattae]
MKKCDIKEIHHDWLRLPDGTRLAYRAWLPENSDRQPVPAILEYLPYRKNDGTIYRDEITMLKTAQQGYACIRVDIRGTGESEGYFDDEYSPQELQDGVDTIAWIASQPWCDGNVGMVGISWGGFNALQIAALQPQALKAIISQCSTDDRYSDDVHYAGGCLLNDNLDWAGYFWAYALGRAPDARLVGDDWQAIWLDRLNNMPMLALPWLSHQVRDDYWKHASVCEDYNAIKIPVYSISGWSDGYRNAVFRLLENLPGIKKGLVGPWCHAYPNMASPKPSIDYITESVRWWDRWLKNVDNGIEHEPELHYYLQQSVLPQADYDYRAGQWVSEPVWPSENTETETLYFSEHGLHLQAQASDAELSICSPQTVGLQGGNFFVGMRIDKEQPVDQRDDDAGSLVFDSDSLTADKAIAGQMKINLKLCSDQAQANLIVRISDVHPSGEVTRISYGVLNLTHRNSHEQPELLQPNQWYDIALNINHIAYVVPQGHKIRVAISTNYWPLIWPSAHSATLRIAPQSCSLQLPLNNAPEVSSAFADYEETLSFNAQQTKPMVSERTLHTDSETGVITLETLEDFGNDFYQSTQSECEFSIHQLRSIHPLDPLSAKNDIRFHVNMGREGWRSALKARYQMTSDADHFYISANWQAYVDGELIFTKDFTETIKRQFL